MTIINDPLDNPPSHLAGPHSDALRNPLSYYYPHPDSGHPSSVSASSCSFELPPTTYSTLIGWAGDSTSTPYNFIEDHNQRDSLGKFGSGGGGNSDVNGGMQEPGEHDKLQLALGGWIPQQGAWGGASGQDAMGLVLPDEWDRMEGVGIDIDIEHRTQR